MSNDAHELMSGVDTAWLRMDSPTNLMIINAMMIIDQMDFDSFKATIRNRFLSYERFKKRPVQHSGHYLWELDPYFDLSNHVHRVALPGLADKEALQAYLADQLSVTFDPDKPLWQIHFIENYIDGVVAILRVHHCYADGISLVSVFHSITDSDPNVKPFISVEVATKKAPLRSDEFYPWPRYQKWIDNAVHTVEKYTQMGIKASEEGLHILRDPDLIKTYANDGLKVVSEIAKLALTPSDPESSLKRHLGVRKTCAWSDPVSLDRIKPLSKELGCKINDLLLSCVAGALREKMLASGDEVDGQVVHVTVPVNIRPVNEGGEGGDKSQQLGNQFGTVFVPLPVGISNPIERVYKLKHDMIELKKSLQPGVSFGLLFVAGLLPKRVQKPLMDVFSKKTSAVMSNVPGSKAYRYFGGARIREQLFWVPQTGGVGLGLSIISYAGHIQFGLIGDEKLFPDAEQIVNQCVKQIDYHHFSHAAKGSVVKQSVCDKQKIQVS